MTYLEKAGATLDEAGSELTRTRVWLQTEQPMFWTREIRKRKRQLDLAEQEMMSARLSRYGKPSAKQVEVVRRYKRALAEAEEKRKTVKAWNMNFDNTADPLKREVNKLQGYIDGDLKDAVRWLDGAIKALQAYAETRPASVSGAKAASGESDSEIDEDEEEIFTPALEDEEEEDEAS